MATEEQTGVESAGTTGEELVRQRKLNRDEIAALGVDPYGGREDGLLGLAEARERYDADADAAHQEHGKEEGFTDERPVVKIAGRIVLRRPTGKLVWLNLRDPSDESFQVAVSKRDCDGVGFGVAQACDIGDIVVAEGPLMKTRTGEVTCWASSLRPGSKSVAPPPEKWSGLQDVEQRYRKRYVDLWANPDTMRVFELRSAIVAALRARLRDMGFMEVETPMLQPQAGGAAARPFVTHMNALGIDLYMRIAPELYLKRLLVGGMRKVFEINRNFRNEGLDKQHNPEFTMLELYEAFGDYHTVMAVTEELVRAAAREACSRREGEEGVDPASLGLPFGEGVVRYAEDFDRVGYAELFERTLGFGIDEHDKAISRATEMGLRVKDKNGASVDPVFIVNELFEEVAEASIDPCRPTWIMDYPAALSPLTRAKRDDATIAERADLFVGHMEIGPHYTELNDPEVQAARFREQLAGVDDEESTFRSYDADFVEALKVGMPPAGGMGLGIDRLVMLMSSQRTIRDVVLFPLMRPSVS